MLNVNDLLSGNRDVTIEFGPGKELHLSYDPNAITSNMLSDLTKSSDTLCDILSELIINWDLKGREGEDYPPTYENLANMKLVVVNKIFEAIIEDSFPKAESTTSQDTTPRRARRVTK